MSYVITGSPGTGKHTVGKMLAEKLRLEIADINLLAAKSGLCKEIDGVIEVIYQRSLQSNGKCLGRNHRPPCSVRDKTSRNCHRRKNPYDWKDL